MAGRGGNTSIKVYKMPGHTAGSPSFEFTVYDGGKPHKAFVFGGPGPRGGVDGGQQFLASANVSWREWVKRVQAGAVQNLEEEKAAAAK